MSELVSIDGSHGEGGGQILRTALALSAITSRPVRLEHIRARRDRPGLRPQHLAVVRAMAQVCAAQLEGDQIGSRMLLFEPSDAPQAGQYDFDIPTLAGAASAGSTTLLFQALVIPLALTRSDSHLRIGGGTHVRWSPPYEYLARAYVPMLARMGFRIDLDIERWGWYPRGGGQITARIHALGTNPQVLTPLKLCERGGLLSVSGVSAASNLPEHVIQRQRERALQRLWSRHIRGQIASCDAPSSGTGTVLFMLAEYEHCAAGFTGYGRLGYPAERVADDAFDAFDAHRKSGAALDPHLADQLVLPLALAPGTSRYTTSQVSDHLLTVAWVVEQFLDRTIEIDGQAGAPGTVTLR